MFHFTTLLCFIVLICLKLTHGLEDRDKCVYSEGKVPKTVEDGYYMLELKWEPTECQRKPNNQRENENSIWNSWWFQDKLGLIGPGNEEKSECVDDIEEKFTVAGLYQMKVTPFEPPEDHGRDSGWLLFHRFCCPNNETFEDVSSGVRERLTREFKDIKQKKDLWERQWKVWGSCSPLAVDEYFLKALELKNSLNVEKTIFSKLEMKKDAPLNKKNVIYALEGEYDLNRPLLMCEYNEKKKSNELSSVYFCFDMNFQHISCPLLFVQNETCTRTSKGLDGSTIELDDFTIPSLHSYTQQRKEEL